tara:strand:- start:186 stop:593 length:408 start_codon:yes stop_codon:yes gene_type:complete
MTDKNGKNLINTTRVVTSIVIAAFLAVLGAGWSTVATTQELTSEANSIRSTIADMEHDVDSNSTAISDVRAFIHEQRVQNALLTKLIQGHTLEIVQLKNDIKLVQKTQALQISNIEERQATANTVLVEIKRLLEK